MFVPYLFQDFGEYSYTIWFDAEKRQFQIDRKTANGVTEILGNFVMPDDESFCALFTLFIDSGYSAYTKLVGV